MSEERDPHFVLRFMDDETVEHELDLDEFQLALCPPTQFIRIGISGEQLKAIRNLPCLRGRVVESWPDDDNKARLIAEKDAEIVTLRELLLQAADQICHYVNDYPQPVSLALMNKIDRKLARGHYLPTTPATKESTGE